MLGGEKGKTKFILIYGVGQGISCSIGCIAGIFIAKYIINKELVFVFSWWFYLFSILIGCSWMLVVAELKWDRAEEKNNELLGNKKSD